MRGCEDAICRFLKKATQKLSTWEVYMRYPCYYGRFDLLYGASRTLRPEARLKGDEARRRREKIRSNATIERGATIFSSESPLPCLS